MKTTVFILITLHLFFPFGLTYNPRTLAVFGSQQVKVRRFSGAKMGDADDDPFAVFDEEVDVAATQPNAPARDAANGPMSFHEGVEQALLQHVKNNFTAKDEASRSAAVIDCIDACCMNVHWMMHVGFEKGAILADFMDKCLQSYQESSASDEPFIVVEIGTYCGYSAIRLLHQIRSNLQKDQNFHLLTVDVNPRHQSVARQLVDLAGLSDHVTFLLLEQSTIGEVISEAMTEMFPNVPVRFVFLDHEKELYLSDLQNLERAKIIKKGCYVAADNVVVFQIDDYRHYLAQLATVGVVETKLHMGHLEYINVATEGHLKDGLECTIYQKNPPLI